MFLSSLNIFSLQNKDIFSNSLLISFLGLLIIFFLLIFGRKLKLAVKLERFGLPIAVISGVIGISIGPFGAIHFLPKEKVSFVIADLGVNSNQIDDPTRGFSFQKDGPLDMRMNPFLEVDAEKLIEALNEKDLANLIYKYGEERLSRKIARKIKLDLKENGKYSGTKELAYSIAGCFPPKQRYKKIHPATRTFQALRIAVNKEIEVLEKFLQIVPEWLLPGGIISIISFHSLEDRLVKSSFKNDQRLKNLTKKPITPSEQEVELNKRARSAKLRSAQLKSQ